jgi:hypothetical protein
MGCVLYVVEKAAAGSGFVANYSRLITAKHKKGGCTLF